MRSLMFVRKIALQLGSLLAFCALVIQSQNSLAQSRFIAHTNIPFDFFVGSRMLPAGRYVISMHANDLLTFSAGEHSQNTRVYPDFSSRPADSSRLIFDHVGNHYFLRDYRIEGATTHLLITEGKAEKQLLSTLKGVHAQSAETKSSASGSD